MKRPPLVVYCTARAVPRPLAEALDNRIRTEIRRPDVGLHVDYYLTTAGLSARSERAAARMTAIPVVLPEGGKWLSQAIRTRLAESGSCAVYFATSVGGEP